MLFTEKQLAHIASEVFACSDYPMLVTDCSGTIVAANNAFSTTSGWQASELIGQNMSMIHSEKHDQDFYKSIWDKLARDGSWAGEIWNRTKDGHTFRECLAIMAVHDGQPAPTNYVAVYCDVNQYSYRTQSAGDKVQPEISSGILDQESLIKWLDSQISGRNHNSTCAILFFDLGHLHSIKESFGIPAGDRLQLAVAQRVSACVRSIDAIGKWSDDAFVIVLPDASDVIAEKVATRILQSVDLPYHIDQHSMTVRISIGISIYPWHGDTPDLLIQNACKAMCSAKEREHKKIVIYDGSD